MKALSVSPDYAALIAEGTKTIECRSWATAYRGELIICATADAFFKDYLPVGMALCVVDLVDVLPYEKKMHDAAQVDADFSGGYAWVLDNVRLIQPVPVRGQQRIYNLSIEPEFVDVDPSDAFEYYVRLGLVKDDSELETE